MATGIVKQFDAKTGQGFIAVEGGGADVFVHYSAASGSPLAEGARVEFEIRKEENGEAQAVDLKPVGPGRP